MDSETIDPDLREQVFDLLPLPALVVDRAGVVRMINCSMAQKMEQLSGKPGRTGTRLSEIFARDEDFLMTDLRAAASGGRLITWLRDAVEDVSGRMCFRVVVMSNGTRSADHYLLIEDRTRPFSRIFTELNVRLRRANEEAAEAHRKHRQLKENYRMLEQFSLVAAHDLKAPLLNISMLLDFLQEEYEDLFDASAQDLVLAAKDSANRLQQLISALLSHARSGAADLVFTTIEVAEAIDAVKRLLSVELRDSGGQIRIIGDLGQVEADPDQFGQLLQNIISNAIKYRAPARAPVIRIERVTHPGRADSLVITDNGRGFDPADKDRLFEPFKRLQPTAEISGTGVGLAICATACERHGWTLDATGIPDVGASFEIGRISQRAAGPRGAATGRPGAA